MDDVSILRCVFSRTSNYFFRGGICTQVIIDWSEIQKCRPVTSESYHRKSNYVFTDRKLYPFCRKRNWKKLKSTSSPKSLQNTNFLKKLLIFRKNRWFWKKRIRKSTVIFSSKNGFSNLGLGYAIIGQKTGMFGWVWWQNSSKRHLKIDRSRFFIFFEINEKKGVLKQNPLNKKSRKLLDELCGRQQCKFKLLMIKWSFYH